MLPVSSSTRPTFCAHCAARLSIGTPEEDGPPRLLCTTCNYVHYENPKILVSCFVTCGTRVLLCQRALEPAYGRWSLPGGFLEEGETLEQAAARETYEETGVTVSARNLALYGLATLTQIAQVYAIFRTSVPTLRCEAGREALRAGFFSENEVPWATIAYPAISNSLRLFFAELRLNRFDVHMASDTCVSALMGYSSAAIERRPCASSCEAE